MNIPKVYDVGGNERNWEWLRDKYQGVYYDLSKEPLVFRLVAVRETIGPAAIVVRVMNEDGSWREGDNVGLYWPGPEKEYSTLGAKSRWQPYVGAVQMTDAGGHTGFGFGGGSVIKEGGGPHFCWILSPTAGSDCLCKFGWLGGTDHAGPLSMDFKLIRGEEPPSPPPSGQFVRLPAMTRTVRVPFLFWELEGTVSLPALELLVEDKT